MAVDKVKLSLSADHIERHCQELARYQAKPERRIAALDALRTFIAAMAPPGEQAKPEFAAINNTLTRHFEYARTALLLSQQELLRQALADQSLQKIVTLYSHLSRDAFWQLLEHVISALSPLSLRQSEAWCRDWLTQVKLRSAAACPYPDTIDFKAAGIEVIEYTAMQDIHHFFTTVHGASLQNQCNP